MSRRVGEMELSLMVSCRDSVHVIFGLYMQANMEVDQVCSPIRTFLIYLIAW